MSFERKTPTLSVKKAWTHEQFLSSLRGKRVWVTVGHDYDHTIMGEIIKFDKYSLLLRCENGKEVLVFKNAISAIEEAHVQVTA
jgi:RNA chaperone Hfq